ncbi:hypothetical protein [uncultured Desulfuromonas sp.]|uniref:hypothetical protein n=1 Tax=uncultured Desulfuromonas sp. TaxID=181013 RepID=UPI002AAC3A9A|nr:hypothetical protein [uncultured Desulfuromonas sp.]
MIEKSKLPHYITYIFCSIFLLMGIVYVSGQDLDGKKLTDDEKSLISLILNSKKAKNGEKLFRNILAAHPFIDQYYYQPSIFGEGTEKPKLSISLPAGVWVNLTPSQQEMIEAYVASEILTVWRTPFKYSVVKADAPGAFITKKNVKNMSLYDWVIIEGKLTNNGRDILSDKTISTGEKWQGQDLSKYF